MKHYVWLVCLLATACREGPDRFAGPDPFDDLPPGEAGRLTWNVYEDHSPAWNATSDTVYYSGRSYPGFPVSGGLLLSVPRTAGRAQLMLESLQQSVSPQPWLAAPALSPNKQSLAFVELTEIDDPTVLCNEGIVCRIPAPPAPQPDTSAANTLLIEARLRVRPLSGSGAEASLTIVFDGLDGETRNAHPYQRQYERDGAEIFRPSWSPDGTRLVFSDGLQLYIWTVGSASATPIPNTGDGVWPAWSPSGDVIAFTRLLRTGVHTVVCDCLRLGRPRPVAVINRVIWHDGNTRIGDLVTIKPDGTGARTLGIGEAPAWSPDGQSLFFQRNHQIWKSAADGSNASPVANTDNGYEPAISPNGQWLTFSRRQTTGEGQMAPKPYDIWVVNF